VPPADALPHTLIDPSVLRAAKALAPLLASIPRFIQLRMPLPPLKLMGQSRRGVTQTKEDQIHALIDPSALVAAKAYADE
jgi:hypothetical protein